MPQTNSVTLESLNSFSDDWYSCYCCSLTPQWRWVQFSNRVPLNMKFSNNNRPEIIVILNTRLLFHAYRCRYRVRLSQISTTATVFNFLLQYFFGVGTSNFDFKHGFITHIHHCLVIENAIIHRSLIATTRENKEGQYFRLRFN